MTRSQKALAGFFSLTGTLHFVIPRSYEAMMPPSLPRHKEAVAVSGIAEIVGGLAVAKPSTRRFARWWLLALLVAVFPANVYMAVCRDRIPDLHVAPWLLWLRLPMQGVFVVWVWYAAGGYTRNAGRPAADPDPGAGDGVRA